MRIGFTGTREGMTIAQWEKVQYLLEDSFVRNMTNEWHDGDCIGADSQAFNTVLQIEGISVTTVSHPCNLGEKVRAGNQHDITHPIYPPLVRNRHIVDSVDMMIAAPQGYDEVLKGSGTWATIRYAERKQKRLLIVWPDGTHEEHNAGLPTT
jgi:hypothetical protein